MAYDDHSVRRSGRARKAIYSSLDDEQILRTHAPLISYAKAEANKRLAAAAAAAEDGTPIVYSTRSRHALHFHSEDEDETSRESRPAHNEHKTTTPTVQRSTNNRRKSTRPSMEINSDSNDAGQDMFSRVKRQNRRAPEYFQAGTERDDYMAELRVQPSRKRRILRDEDEETGAMAAPSIEHDKVLYGERVRVTRTMSRRALNTQLYEREEEETEEDEANGDAVTTSRYHLREKRTEVQRLQYSDRRVRPVVYDESAPSSSAHPVNHMAFHSPAHKRVTRFNGHATSRRQLASSGGPVGRRRRRTRDNSTSTSSSDDGVKADEVRDERRFERRADKSLDKARHRFLPLNIDGAEATRGVLGNRVRAANMQGGSSCADIDPMSIDRSITFDSIGGLSRHMHALKEMVLFPMLYPEVYTRFAMAPPRGVLFYGPPGTGKTLVARALANECSSGERRVAFFMRKGADCLSKWVGESERQLRVLFDQAYTMRPSIIFFDEIDGLAPVRSSRQDQIHSSIVSTLLALMDGLDSRAEVVVIGATNRLDSIDPALRRPGRFDREFRFTLPDRSARRTILDIHTRAWQPTPPPPAVLDRLADKCIGCCGADLRAICAEAALIALRRTYPQIYDARHKLVLDVSAIDVSDADFNAACAAVQPASRRGVTVPVRPLSDRLRPLLSDALDRIIDDHLPELFRNPPPVDGVDFFCTQTTSHSVGGARLLVCAPSSDYGQTSHLAPALLHRIDHIPVHSLAIANIYAVSSHRSAEEAVAEIMQTAVQAAGYGRDGSASVPCALFIPAIDRWHEVVGATVWHTFVGALDALPAHQPVSCSFPAHTHGQVFIFATAHTDYESLHDDIKYVFSSRHTYALALPTLVHRTNYFNQLIVDNPMVIRPPPAPRRVQVLLPAPIAPPRQLSAEELRYLRKQEEMLVRQLRLFLREMHGRLFRDRRFQIFAKPVDPEDAPDYNEVIDEPMDLSTIMTKIDKHAYSAVAHWLADIDLICKNALEYNPDRDINGKRIRHAACTLRDTAYALIDAELDEAFEERIAKMRALRAERGDAEIIDQPPQGLSVTPTKAVADTAFARTPVEFQRQQMANLAPATVRSEDGTATIGACVTPVTTERTLRRRPQTTAGIVGGRHKKRTHLGKHRFNGLQARNMTAVAAIKRKYALRGGGGGQRPVSVDEQAATSSRADSDMSNHGSDAKIVADSATTSHAPMEQDTTDVPTTSDSEGATPPIVFCPVKELNACVTRAIHVTNNWTLNQLDVLGVQLDSIIQRFSLLYDRTQLAHEIMRVINDQSH